MSHVIAAVSTGSQISAIGILRLSGSGCAQVAGQVFRPKSGRPLEEAPNRKLVLGALQDRQGRVLDQCMAVFTLSLIHIASAPFAGRRSWRQPWSAAAIGAARAGPS